MIDVQDNVLRFFVIDHVLVYFVTIATTVTVSVTGICLSLCLKVKHLKFQCSAPPTVDRRCVHYIVHECLFIGAQ